ncbi:MAG: PLP-dependent aminotransferase family protein, partial [Gaiellaceae bacterium]
TYISPPFLTQATISEFLERELFEPNLRRVCDELRARRDAMLTALEGSFRGEASWSRPDGGYFVWLELGEGRSASELAARAGEEGIAFVRGEDFFPLGSGRGGSSARLAFSYEPPERIAEGIERLARLL